MSVRYMFISALVAVAHPCVAGGWCGRGVLMRVRTTFFTPPQQVLRIPAKLDTHSAANWTLIPRQIDHQFQRKLDTSGVAARGLF